MFIHYFTPVPVRTFELQLFDPGDVNESARKAVCIPGYAIKMIKGP